MEKVLKKNLKILAAKFNHSIEYEKDVLLLKNEVNEIRIWEKSNSKISVSYNVDQIDKEQLTINTDSVYDLMLQLLSRKDPKILFKAKSGILLTIEEWIKEEGDFLSPSLEELKRDFQDGKINSKNLGGNRYLATFFNGILILTDDLCWAKSNVIQL